MSKNIYDVFNDSVDNLEGVMPDNILYNGINYDIITELGKDKRSLSIFAVSSKEKIKLEVIGYSGEKLFTYA
jgi:hypothetical protein